MSASNHKFNIEPWDWLAYSDGQDAADIAAAAISALPAEVRKSAWEAATLYIKTDGAEGSMDALDAIGDAAIAKVTAGYHSRPQSGHTLSIYPV